jgi:hypothetical protein
MTDDKQTDKSISSEPAAIVPTEVISIQPTMPSESKLEMQSLLLQTMQAKLKSGDLSVLDTIVNLQAEQVKFDQSLKQQELDLRRRESDQKHEIALKQNEIASRSNQSTNTNIRLAIGAVCGVLLSTMVYAGFTKDSAFSNQLITGVFGLLGGGGVTSALTKKDKPADPKP